MKERIKKMDTTKKIPSKEQVEETITMKRKETEEDKKTMTITEQKKIDYKKVKAMIATIQRE